MAKEPFEQFAMPNEVRAFVEQSVTQARAAFDGIATAATQAVAQWQGQAQAAAPAPVKSLISRWRMPKKIWRRRSSSRKS